MSNILFDFDGTLFDTYPGISDSVAKMMSEMGMKPLEANDYGKFIGPPVHIGFHDYLGFGGDDLERAVEIFRKHYGESGIYESRPYSGIPELLKKLKDSGAILAVASSKPQYAVDKLLEINGMSKLFDKVAGADGVERSPDKSERLKIAASEKNAVMVGDRKYDIEAAKKVGFTAVGVTYGFGSREELWDAGADIVCDSVEELEKILMGIVKERI